MRQCQEPTSSSRRNRAATDPAPLLRPARWAGMAAASLALVACGHKDEAFLTRTFKARAGDPVDDALERL